jgi:hypothetical protein
MAVAVAAPQLPDEGLALLLGHRRQRHTDLLDAVEGLDRCGDVGRDPVAERTALDREEDVHVHRAAVDLDALEHADVLDRTSDLGVPDAPERFADLLLGCHRRFLSRFDVINTVTTVEIQSTTLTR